MEKTYKLQKLMALLYAACGIVLFIYALWFMTDFKDLFGLELKRNLPVAQFHDEYLQIFNQKIFFSALVIVASIFIEYALELWTKVPDVFAIAVFSVILVFAATQSCFAIRDLSYLEEIYSSLDFSAVAMEGGIEYIANDRAFLIGIVLYSVSIACFVLFGFVLILSHVMYRKEGR